MLIEPESATKWVGWATAALIGAAIAIRKVVGEWAKSRGDMLGIDAAEAWKAEAKMQRDRADVAFKERNEAQEELGRLRSEVIYLKRMMTAVEAQSDRQQVQIERQQQQINELERRLNSRP